MLVKIRKVRALFVAPDPFNQPKSLAAHPAVIIVFKLAILSLPLIDNDRLHGNDKMVETILCAVPTDITCINYSSLLSVEACGFKMTTESFYD